MRPTSTYWIEAVASALDEHDIVATQEQIAAIAHDMETASEMESEYCHGPIANPLQTEIDRLERARKDDAAKHERDRVAMERLAVRARGIDPDRYPNVRVEIRDGDAEFRSW